MRNPMISILMGIYNCESTLIESIESIVNQTYKSWELIICDDGSIDNSLDIARTYEDRYKDKIRVISNQMNIGLAATLNNCLVYATGKYIARQDGDDISISDRLEKQVKFLESEDYYSILSSSMILFDENGEWGFLKVIEEPSKFDFIKGSPFAHAPSMIRKDALLSIGGYDNKRYKLRVEDYDLWFRMYEKGYLGYNIKEPLYKARDDRNAVSRRKFKYRINETLIKINGFHRLKLPIIVYIHALKPLIVGLLPKFAYNIIRKKKRAL